eukprot:UN07123
MAKTLTPLIKPLGRALESPLFFWSLDWQRQMPLERTWAKWPLSSPSVRLTC